MKSGMRRWADLPPELLSLILSRLIVVDSTAFSAVCKSWQSIIPTEVRHFFPATDFPLCESPCLMSLHDSLCKFYHPVNNATYRVDIPDLSGMRICASNFGWLLLKKCSTIFFFNPFTKDRLDLPDLYFEFTYKFHFSFPPTSPNCTVIGLAGCNRDTRVFLIKHGEPRWRFLGLGRDGMIFFSSCRCAPVFSNNKYYFMGETCNIGVFDVEGGSWEFRYVSYNKRWPRSLLVEEKDGSPESLLAVFMSFEYRNVMRLDLLEMVWEEVENLGSDKVLYFSDGGSYLETSFARGMGNKIYVQKFHRGNGVLYSLAARKFYSVDGSYSSEDHAKFLEPLQCAWIKPSFTKIAVEELIWCDQR